MNQKPTNMKNNYNNEKNDDCFKLRKFFQKAPKKVRKQEN